MCPTISTTTRVDKVRQAKQTLDQHLEDLAEQLRQGKSAKLIRYLQFCAQFHSYSFGNILLALSQCPQMTRIAGIRTWNRQGRHVRAGEKGIMILAPIKVLRKGRDKAESNPTNETADKESSEEERRTVMLFKPVYVFDVSQTEGAELPSLIHASGDVSAYYPTLLQAVQDAGIQLEYLEHVPGCPGALGASFKGRVVLRGDLSDADGFRTLAHEFAHEILHGQSGENRTVRETEADAAAYIVCRHFGADCDTADYLLLYNSEPQILLDRLETIRQTAARIIDAVGDEAPHAKREVPATFSEKRR